MNLQDKDFIWDENKRMSNKNKHGISFEEAATVFKDRAALYSADIWHSEDEDRFIIIGRSEQNNILMVCHCYREDDTVIRIISARKANKKERAMYGR